MEKVLSEGVRTELYRSRELVVYVFKALYLSNACSSKNAV